MKKLLLAICALAVLLALPGSAAAGPSGDRDRDGVDDRNERRQGTDPRRRDTDRDKRADGREDADRDGLANAVEDATGNDPMDRDSDDDGIRDGREGAGSVASFADGTLTIVLARGGSASGRVDGFTDLSCASEAGYERGHLRRGAPNKSFRRGRGGGERRSGRGRRSPSRSDPSIKAADVSGEEGAELEPEEWYGGEEPDMEWLDDEDPSDDEEDDEWSDEEEWSDEDDGSGEDTEEWDHGESDEATGDCATLLREGVSVHASALGTDDEGTYFVVLELVR